MTGRKTISFLLVIVCMTAMSPAAFSGVLHPELETLLQQAEPDAKIEALVILKQQTDIASLKEGFKASKTTRQMRHETVVLALKDTASIGQENLLKTLETKAVQSQVESIKSFWLLNAISLKATGDILRQIAAREDVNIVQPDSPLSLIEPVSMGPIVKRGKATAEVENGIELTGAPELWAMGIDGTGALVCDMDTGADGTHVAFADRWRGNDPGVSWEAAWFYPKGGSEVPIDTGSHGTHTLGTILGKDGDHVIGMAPGAKWIAAAVIDVPGQSTETDALATMEWTTDPDGNPATVDDVPDVTNNSWGFRANCEDVFWTALDNAEAAGTVYVWAAGNEGPWAKTLRSPGDRSLTEVNAFSVGALKQDGTSIARFSSRGPSDCDGGEIKPEVSAVGEDVMSSTPGDNFRTMSGTSMAAPHVSGAVALLRSAHPDATVDEIKYALYHNTVDLGDAGEDNTFGTGRIDVVAALGELGFTDQGGVKGQITITESGDPIPGVTVTLVETSQETTSATDGVYRMIIADAGTYTVQVYHPDYGTFSKEAQVAIGPWTVVDFDLSNVPVADFESDKTEACQGEQVQFTSLADGLITAYVWGFTDGNVAFEADPLLTFNTPGPVTVSLYVGGPTGEDTKEVADYLMVNTQPTADFNASEEEVETGQEVTFTDLSQGPATAWTWDFGDGETSDQQNPVHAYEEEGAYTVTLTASNDCGQNVSSKEGYITVLEGADDDDNDANDDDDDDDDDDGCGC